MESNLYGVHDQEGAHLVPAGGYCVALVALSENAGGVNYTAIRDDIHWLVRVNWGYGTTGTIPLARLFTNYLAALANLVMHSKGIHGIIIGNEPNHPQERPDNQPISVDDYTTLYGMAYATIKRLAPGIKVGPAAVAPYRIDNGQRWNDYLHEMLSKIECDFVTVHAYPRSSNPSDVSNPNIRMDGPLQGQYAGFLTYEDALMAIPSDKKHLPVHITETNPLLENGWEDANTGVVKAIYREINDWNRTNPAPLVHSVSLYRYPKYDKWYIEGKNGVIQDFKEAVLLGYKSPNVEETKVDLPIVKDEPPPKPASPAEIDPRATARGVKIEPAPPGEAWRIVKVQWFDRQEVLGVGPDHHLLFDTLDEQGNRVTGVSIVVTWPTGAERVTSEAKPGERFSANFPMSPGQRAFSATVVNAMPSDRITGVGMGQDTEQGFNPGIHTSTFVVFQRLKRGVVAVPEPQKPPQKVEIGALFTPVQRPQLPIISQGFGENAADYSRFGLKGHNGIDFAVPVGSAVYAVDNGKVIERGDDPSGYGLYLKIRHEWGESLYAHLDSRIVAVDQVVSVGQKIGLSGNTGNTTGPHLHFGIRINPYNRADGFQGYSDPEPYLFPVRRETKDSVIEIVRDAAEEFGLDPNLMWSLAWAESSFNPKVNKDGLFQISDAVWQDYGGSGNKLNARDNARVASNFMKVLLNYYHGDIWKALYAYNWGIGNVDSGATPPQITQTYANKVIHGRDLLLAMEVNNA